MQLRSVEFNLEGSVKDACGNPLPPCLVMERGEALDLWVARAHPDRSQAFSVCLTSLFGACNICRPQVVSSTFVIQFFLQAYDSILS
jgi:hypothetical protein